MRFDCIINIILATSLVTTASYGQESRMEDSIHQILLKPGITLEEKPEDMLQRNCSDCHAAEMYSSYLYSLLLDTITSKEKMIHSWLSCTTYDSLREIQIQARGINNFTDTLPAKKAMGLAYVQRYFGWELISLKPFFTDDSGRAVFQVPAGIRGDSSGFIRMMIKLADEKAYPNAKIKIRRKWGEINKTEDPLNSENYHLNRRNILYREIRIFYSTGVAVIMLILAYVFYLIGKIATDGKKPYF